MTELMKQYESELANEGLGELKRISDIVIRILDKQVEILQAENAKLKAQLTWHPVSEKPEKEGWYLCKVLYIDDTIGEETVHFGGERFMFGNVVKWLPIPKEGM